jgi:hypothetical protein
MACGEIVIGSAPDLCNPPAGGTEAVAYVWNYSDLESITYQDDDPEKPITAITMKAGKNVYKFTGLNQAFLKSEDFARSASTGIGRFKHKHTLVIYERAQEQKNNIKNLGNARIMAVLVNRGQDDDKFELAGMDVGMELQAGEIRNAYANDGFFVLNMATPEGEVENEGGPMHTVFNTDLATTEAMLEALLPTS